MSPVGVTPLAATLNDLASVYLANRDSLEALLTQVDVDINGVAVAAVPATELEAPLTEVAPSSTAGDTFASLAAPAGSGGVAAGGAAYDAAHGSGARMLAPYQGLMGDALSAG